jgi:hypothetical protein
MNTQTNSQHILPAPADEDYMDPIDDLLERIQEHQAKVIRKRFGAKAAKIANYGWAVFHCGSTLEVDTKIYVHHAVLSTAGHLGEDLLKDTWIDR